MALLPTAPAQLTASICSTWMGFFVVSPTHPLAIAPRADSSACPCATSTTRPHGPVGAGRTERISAFFSAKHLAARRPRAKHAFLRAGLGLGRHARGRSRSRPANGALVKIRIEDLPEGSSRHGDVGSGQNRYAARPGRALADRTLKSNICAACKTCKLDGRHGSARQ